VTKHMKDIPAYPVQCNEQRRHNLCKLLKNVLHGTGSRSEVMYKES